MEALFTNKKNTSLYNLSKAELEDYLIYLNDFYIDYQNILNINKNYTFGFEIEYEFIDKQIMDEFIKNFKKWRSTAEKGIDIGGEIVSPILTDSQETWKNLKKITSFLKENYALTQNVGAHIHIGSNILGDDLESWKNFIYLYTTFENIIYRFCNGEYINGRPRQKTVAYMIAIELAQKIDEINNSKNLRELSYVLHQQDRFQGLNLQNVVWDLVKSKTYKNTIEFRMPNGTDKKEIWQNNLYFFIKFIEAAKNKELDFKYLFDNIDEIGLNYNYFYYYKLDIPKALYLSDIIFDNNFDKARFLKQYIKDRREIITDEYIKAEKKLIRIPY